MRFFAVLRFSYLVLFMTGAVVSELFIACDRQTPPPPPEFRRLFRKTNATRSKMEQLASFAGDGRDERESIGGPTS